MLVSSIARVNALQQRNLAQSNIMNTYMSMGSMMRNLNGGTFNGMNDLRSLQAMDTQMQLDLENNKLNYLFYSLWEKSLKQQQAKEIKENFSGLNVIA